MPFWAFLHFYCITIKLKDVTYQLVSMPFWAFLHFYWDGVKRNNTIRICVNALLGFPSFLRYFFMPSHLRWFFVSMPFWAFLHFYAIILAIKLVVGLLCQCPSGLSFISTASFWNPQKQSIFQAFFAGIYLKILKTRFFRLYFVLFTICSYFNTNHSCT